LNNSKPVRPELREKVMKAVEGFYSHLLYGVDSVISEFGYSMFLASIHFLEGHVQFLREMQVPLVVTGNDLGGYQKAMRAHGTGGYPGDAHGS